MNISSAACCVCATSSVNVPGHVIVFRKNRAATQVVIPIWRAFSTMFRRPRRFSNAVCARFALSGVVHPSRVLTSSNFSVSAMPIVRPFNLDGRSSRSFPNRSNSFISKESRRILYPLALSRPIIVAPSYLQRESTLDSLLSIKCCSESESRMLINI